jgi:hypothetical protein
MSEIASVDALATPRNYDDDIFALLGGVGFTTWFTKQAERKVPRPS